MAIASTSLMNMSVATDTAPSNLTLLMPKLQFRFRVGFINFGTSNETSVMTRQVVDVTRPNVSFAEIPVHIYNSTIKLAGKHTWADVTINLRDDASGQVSTMVGQQLQKQLDFMEQASASSGQDYKFELTIEVLDGGNGATTPIVLEYWQLEGCYLKTANYNNMNYATNEAATIQLIIAYDNAVQSTQAGNTGSATGVGGPINPSRTIGVATGVGAGLPG
jgi:hypothetical protein